VAAGFGALSHDDVRADADGLARLIKVSHLDYERRSRAADRLDERPRVTE
jgi:hypothetical protein